MRYLLRFTVFVSIIMLAYIFGAFLSWELNPGEWWMNQDYNYDDNFKRVYYTDYVATRIFITILFIWFVILPSERMFSDKFRKKYGIN